MILEEFEEKYVSRVFGAICVYEAVAVLFGRVPTISSIIRMLYRTIPGRIIIWLGFGWFVAHIFTPIMRESK